MFSTPGTLMFEELVPLPQEAEKTLTEIAVERRRSLVFERKFIIVVSKYHVVFFLCNYFNFNGRTAENTQTFKLMQNTSDLLQYQGDQFNMEFSQLREGSAFLNCLKNMW